MLKMLCSAVLLCAVLFCGCEGDTKQVVVEDGKPKAEIVITKNAPRMVALAALELQYYIKKISGAKLPVVYKTTDKYPLKIYVGESSYTKALGISPDGLKYGAFKMSAGPGYLALVGHDFDYIPPKPASRSRGDKKRAWAEWDKVTAKATDSKWELPWRTKFKRWWNPRDLKK